MANTRFYLASSGSTTLTPAFSAGWEQTGEAVRLPLVRKGSGIVSALTDFTVTIPITTTQDILVAQFISEPLPAASVISLNMSGIVRCVEANAGGNCFLAFVVRSFRPSTLAFQAILNFTNSPDIEAGTTASTRTMNNASATIALAAGDVLVVEWGFSATTPSVGTTASMRFGTNASSDFAFTSGLTTDLNPWIEFTDLGFNLPNNYQFIKAGDGMSVTEKIR